MSKPYHEDEQKALAKAFQYLLRRDHSRLELRKKLAHKGFSSSAIQGAMEELEELHYVDDVEFGRVLVRHCQVYKRQGLAAVRAELSGKGVTGEDADRAIEEYSEEIEEENLRHLIRNLKNSGKEHRQIVTYLQRRGYYFGNIKKALRDLEGEEPEDLEHIEHSEEIALCLENNFEEENDCSRERRRDESGIEPDDQEGNEFSGLPD